MKILISFSLVLASYLFINIKPSLSLNSFVSEINNTQNFFTYSTASIENNITEVYVNKNTNRFSLVKNLYSRITIFKQVKHPIKDFENFFELPLQNKKNKSLSKDSSFITSSFNPLKYNFSMFSNIDFSYRLGNSDYVINIKALN